MRDVLTSRYLFRGSLVMLSALHIGGGTFRYSSSKSPVVRTAEGLPFIPGSSFKGVFRSTVEKLSAALPGLEPCRLHDESNECPTVHQKDYNLKRKSFSEEQFCRVLNRALCSCCRVFGSPYTAGKLFFQDLYPTGWSGTIPVRDGVGIDRDSGRAVDENKYDYEVVEAGTTFGMEMLLDGPEGTDLAMVCLGLQELTAGLFYVGGMRSRGLGSCCLNDLQVYRLDLSSGDETERLKKLSRYLRESTVEKKMDLVDNPQELLEQQLAKLLTFSDTAPAGDRNNQGEGGFEHA